MFSFRGENICSAAAAAAGSTSYIAEMRNRPSDTVV